MVKKYSVHGWYIQLQKMRFFVFAARYLTEYDALMETFDDPRLNNSAGNASRTDAKALAAAFCKFKFMLSLVTLYNIL